MSHNYVRGDNWGLCHVCGETYRASQLRKRWDGLLVCGSDYESKHPQENVRAQRRPVIPAKISPEPDDSFVELDLDAPSDLMATGGELSVSLTWVTHSHFADGYVIERCTGSACSGFAEVGRTSERYYRDTGLSRATLYRYRVRAYKGSREGDASDVAEAETDSDWFSATIYTGDAAYPRTISLTGTSAEEGLVWVKRRDGAGSHQLTWAVNGTRYVASTDTTSAPTAITNVSFSADQMTLSSGTGFSANTSAATYVAWAFHRQAGFFDIVRYTGNGSASRAITHSLGSVPKMWFVIPHVAGIRPFYHVGMDATAPWDYRMDLVNDNLRAAAVHWGNAEPTSSVFYVGQSGVNGANSNGVAYDAFLFGVGDSMAAASAYTGNGNAVGPTITNGFLSRFVLLKRATASSTGRWKMLDTARTPDFSGNEAILSCNTDDAESSATQIAETADGFQIVTSDTTINTNAQTHIQFSIAER